MKHSERDGVSALYRDASRLESPDSLDQKILAAARQHAPEKPAYFSRNWLPLLASACIGGLAVFIAMPLFEHGDQRNTGYLREQEVPLRPHVETESVSVAAPSPAAETTDGPASQPGETDAVSAAPPSISDRTASDRAALNKQMKVPAGKAQNFQQEQRTSLPDQELAPMKTKEALEEKKSTLNLAAPSPDRAAIPPSGQYLQQSLGYASRAPDSLNDHDSSDRPATGGEVSDIQRLIAPAATPTVKSDLKREKSESRSQDPGSDMALNEPTGLGGAVSDTAFESTVAYPSIAEIDKALAEIRQLVDNGNLKQAQQALDSLNRRCPECNLPKSLEQL